MKDSIEKGKKIGQNTSPNSLRGPLTDSAMQKVANFYLKIGKAPGPDNIQAELVKTMQSKQLRVIKLWLNEILAEGKPLTTVTEKEMTVRLDLLHKGGSKADRSSHWRPVVLLNCTNQIIAYIVNERLTEMVENAHIDETTGNVWHRLAAFDHLLDTDSWKHGEPPQGQGISFATATRHLRILKRRIEEIMGTSVRHQDTHRIWKDISKEQWE